MTSHVFNLADAAKACQLSQSTLRRKRAELLKAGATFKDNVWRIPLTTLLELGLMPRTTPADVTPADSLPAAPVTAFVDGSTQTTMTADDSGLQSELDTMRRELQEYRERALVAESVLQERDRLLRAKDEVISAQSSALRMLERAPEQPQVSQPASTEPTPVSEPDVAAPVMAPVTRDALPVIPEPRKWWKRGR